MINFIKNIFKTKQKVYSKNQLIDLGYHMLVNYSYEHNEFKISEVFKRNNVPIQLSTSYHIWGGIVTKAIKEDKIEKLSNSKIYRKKYYA